MDEQDLDDLMQQAALQPPPDFTGRVMRALPAAPLRTGTGASMPAPHWSRWRWFWTATGLVGGGALGLSQLCGFVLGLWLAGAAL